MVKKGSAEDLYQDYGSYQLFYNQLNLPSPSVEHAWRRTKLILQNEMASIIRAKLKQNKVVKVADIGCGNGALLLRLASEFKELKVEFIGFDISKPFIDYGNKAAAYKKLTNISFKVFNIDKESLPDSTYDLIISSEVLEHLHQPRMALGKIYQALNSEGYFLLTTPNSQNWIKYPFLFLKNFILQRNTRSLEKHLAAHEKNLKLAEEEQHIKVYAFNELKKAVLSIGFKVYSTPRSTTLFGGEVLDNHFLLFALLLTADVFFDFLSFPQIGWDSILFCQKQ